MWLRFAAISALKWIVQNFLTILVLLYLIPNSWHGYTVAAPVWVLTVVVSAAFAYWALHIKRPSWKNVILLAVIWFVISLFFQTIFEFIFLGRLFFILRSLELLLIFLLEILTIFGMGWYLRFTKKGEGKPEGVAL
ncbi:hypothetical protein HZC53_06095 [Candidatus Uhrbacteria bacterium]|nr:hypothetical protein [Candidatus Uhrbacteria bacterium]